MAETTEKRTHRKTVFPAQVLLPPHLMQRLDTLAAERISTRSGVLRDAFREYLKRHDAREVAA